MRWDVFISHASEDKDEVAKPLAELLTHNSLRVWLDENELQLGDNLREKIDHGLAESRYGVVILSRAFFSKDWPRRELDGLLARESGQHKVILPVWHRVDHRSIRLYSPVIADRLAISTDQGLDKVASAILSVIRPNALESLTKENVDHTVRETESLFRLSSTQAKIISILSSKAASRREISRSLKSIYGSETRPAVVSQKLDELLQNNIVKENQVVNMEKTFQLTQKGHRLANQLALNIFNL